MLIFCQNCAKLRLITIAFTQNAPTTSRGTNCQDCAKLRLITFAFTQNAPTTSSILFHVFILRQNFPNLDSYKLIVEDDIIVSETEKNQREKYLMLPHVECLK